MRVLGIIPARSGSKRLPKKNIKPLLGKPLIDWTIIQAVNCGYFDDVVVSSDSREVLARAGPYGLKRPKRLAKDDSSTVDVALYVLGQLDKKFDAIAILEPTSPLRKKDDIDNAIKLLNDKANAVVSMGKVPNMIAYFPYGVIYLIKVEALKKYRTFYPPKTIPYLIERWQTYEIDDIWDFYCVEAIMRKRLKI